MLSQRYFSRIEIVDPVDGERIEERPGPRYPGGVEAQRKLRGKRFYACYQRLELLGALRDFKILREQKLIPGNGEFEFWLRKSYLGKGVAD